MLPPRAPAFIAAAALAAVVLLVSGAGADTPTPVSGGVVTVGVEQDGNCLNPLLVNCQAPVLRRGALVALPGAFRVAPDLSYQPMLADSVDVGKPAAKRPFSLTYHIDPAAVWSDGAPVTADDFIFTSDVIRDPANDIATRAGYDEITQAVKADDKTVTFSFSQPYAPWKTLFPVILPKHILQGTDFNQDFLTEIADPVTHVPIGSGPFLVSNWSKTDSLTLTRNPLWWGPHAPYLDGIVLKVVSDSNVLLSELVSGQLDVAEPSTSVALATLRTTPGIALEETGDLFKEHLDFNVASASMPLLAQPWFRQALAYSIDRMGFVHAFFGTLDPNLQPLQSLTYLPQQPAYQADFSRYTYSPAKVSDLMIAHGCLLGTDGIWTCGGVRASVGITVTIGNTLRETAEQMFQLSARGAGIELVPQNLSANVIFTPAGIVGGNFQTAEFADVFGANDPSEVVDQYACNGTSNYGSYCSQPVTDLLNASQTELNERKRTLDVNGADAILANDVPSLPLYQRPNFVAHSTTVHGITNDAGPQGPTWDTEEWWKG